MVSLDDFLNGDEVAEAELGEALEHLVTLNEAKKEISEIYESFSRKMIDRMASEKSTEMRLDSGVEVKCMASTPRKKWDNENLLSDVYDRIQQSSIDMDTGEVGLTSKEIVIKILDYVSPSYWRVKALDELGINADMYCETSEPKMNVAIFGANKKRDN